MAIESGDDITDIKKGNTAKTKGRNGVRCGRFLPSSTSTPKITSQTGRKKLVKTKKKKKERHGKMIARCQYAIG